MTARARRPATATAANEHAPARRTRAARSVDVEAAAANGTRNGHRPGPSRSARARPTLTTVDSDDTVAANGYRSARSPSGTDREVRPDIWEERVADALAFLRRRLTGDYHVDEFGFDAELTDGVFYPLLRLLYQHYFRVECSGIDRLPVDGPALLVGNHSGTLPVDALMLSLAVHDETPAHRHLRLLGADLVFRVPVLSELARKGGATLASNPDAERLLRAGDYVGVFPEGFKGIGKYYRDRYRLQRFGRGGFVSAALRTGTPIVPVAIVGAEEIFPIIGNITPLAKVLGLPYVPITPLFPWFGLLGLLPLPSKWLIQIGEPIPTTGLTDDADDPIVVFNLADQVRETIQETLHSLLQRRPDPFG